VSTSLPEVPSDELTPLVARAVDLGHAGMALIEKTKAPSSMDGAFVRG